jgi:DNA-binding response OmpR family regulator
LNNN